MSFLIKFCEKQLFICLILISFLGCNKEYNIDSCHELAFKKYHGQPNASNEYDKNCKNLKLHYTPKLCQKALGDLINNGKEDYLKKKYGKEIIKCFTKKDLNLFLK